MSFPVRQIVDVFYHQFQFAGKICLKSASYETTDSDNNYPIAVTNSYSELSLKNSIVLHTIIALQHYEKFVADIFHTDRFLLR